MDLTCNGSALRGPIESFCADLGALERLYPIEISPSRRTRLARLFEDWLERVDAVDFEALDRDAKADHILFRRHLGFELRNLEIQAGRQNEAAPLLPFTKAIVELEESRRRFERIDAREAAATLDGIRRDILAVRRSLEEGLTAGRHVAHRAATETLRLREHLKAWFEFYRGYDPELSWWAGHPYQEADQELEQYADYLKEKLVGVAPDDDQAIVGNPAGREALLEELRASMIDYTPEELIEIGEREYAWCEREMVLASQELGFGDDWRKALEHVKGLHVPPGEQPRLVRDLAVEAIAYLRSHDLVTVPALAEETWRMEMMPPEKQKVNPFFLGGETIIVSFPTHEMAHEQKLMSLRGNNAHFSRATVQHELIPGHHLQFFMLQRHLPYRELFGTPFWIEGWALYWEMLLWDLGFPRGPEDRVGMLFWRMHRAVRIVFSLRFHLGEIGSDECIAMLVDRVGHEPANAEGEVRRSFGGNYPPLYQAAYMVGGLQFRAMSRELVGEGRLSYREFHDRILRENQMPVPLLRAILSGTPLQRDFAPNWRFAS